MTYIIASRCWTPNEGTKTEISIDKDRMKKPFPSSTPRQITHLSNALLFLSIEHPLHQLRCPLQQPHQLPRRNSELHRVLTGRKHKAIGPQYQKGLPARLPP